MFPSERLSRIIWLHSLFIASCIAITACAVGNHRERVKIEMERWLFIDLRSGALAFLSKEEMLFVVGEEGVGASFCSSESDFYCFSTEIVDFAVPRSSINLRKEWEYNDRIYCVVRQFFDQSNSSNGNVTFLIYSKNGKKCDDGNSFDSVFVFSPITGLRLIIKNNLDTGENFELFSSESIGFGIGLRHD